LIIVLIIAIAISLTRKEGGGEIYVYPPTEAPTAFATIPWDEEYRDFLIQQVSEEVLDPSSAYYHAAKWALFNDELSQNVTKPKFLQRYILALFYLQTSQGLTKPWLSCGPPQGIDEDETCTYLEFGRLPDQAETATHFPLPGQFRWLSNVDECQWVGVTCGAGNEVIGIRVVGQGLTGTLPTELKALPFLQQISLNYNELTGTISPVFASFRHLLQFEVYGNLLSGAIPSEFFQQDDIPLITLGLGDNMLAGTLDTHIGRLSDLKGIHLFANNLEGKVPQEIGDLPYLAYLRLHRNSFSGQMPSSLGKLSLLTELMLDQNGFTGFIPTEYGQLKRMDLLDLGENSLSGTIPPEVFNMTQARSMAFNSNQLRGPLPTTSLLQMTNLLAIRVDRNGLNGPIPSELGALANLIQVYVHLNEFTGPVPVELCGKIIQADCFPDDSPPNPCQCCFACCDRTTETCLRL